MLTIANQVLQQASMTNAAAGIGYFHWPNRAELLPGTETLINGCIKFFHLALHYLIEVDQDSVNYADIDIIKT